MSSLGGRILLIMRLASGDRSVRYLWVGSRIDYYTRRGHNMHVLKLSAQVFQYFHISALESATTGRQLLKISGFIQICRENPSPIKLSINNNEKYDICRASPRAT